MLLQHGGGLAFDFLKVCIYARSCVHSFQVRIPRDRATLPSVKVNNIYDVKQQKRMRSRLRFRKSRKYTSRSYPLPNPTSSYLYTRGNSVHLIRKHLFFSAKCLLYTYLPHSPAARIHPFLDVGVPAGETHNLAFLRLRTAKDAASRGTLRHIRGMLVMRACVSAVVY